MTKVLKYVGNSVGITLEWLLVSIIVFLFAIRTSPFQTFLAKQLATYLSNELHTTINIDKVDIVFFDRASIEGFTLLDQRNDTLVSTPTLFVTIDDFNIDDNSFELNEINLEKGNVTISKDKNGKMNYQFLVDYFSSDEPSTAPPLRLSVDKINLNQVEFKYVDESTKPIPFGIDFNHLNFKKLSVGLTEFEIKNEDISLQINNLSFVEKSGFELDQFTSKVKVGPKGISLEKLSIELPNSKISAPHFNLNYNSWSSFDYFEDSVEFDALIERSEISFKDLSFWVPDLEGMEDKITLKCEVKDNLSKLKLTNFESRIFNNSFVKGNFVLPDFRDENLEKFNLKIVDLYLDFNELARIKLPNGTKKIDFSDLQRKLVFLELKDVRSEGSLKEFRIFGRHINTASGNVSCVNGIEVLTLKNGFNLRPKFSDEVSILNLNGIDLSKLIEDENLGLMSGEASFKDIVIADDGSFSISNFNSNISNVAFQGYNYRNCTISAPIINDKEFTGVIKIADPNLNLALDGKVKYSGKQNYKVKLDINNANLSKLGFVDEDSLIIKSNLDLEATGNDVNNMQGSLSSSFSKITQGSSSIDIPDFKLDLIRVKGTDNLNLESEALSAKVKGKIDYNNVLTTFLEDLSVVFPSLYLSKNRVKRKKESTFDFDVRVGEVSEILDLFLPELSLSNGTEIIGNYDSKSKEINVDLASNNISYENIQLHELKLNQSISSNGIDGFFKIKDFEYDSIEFDNVAFDNIGKNGLLESRLTWDLNGKDFSELAWTTMVIDQNDLRFTIKPSFFSLENFRWEITNQAQIALGANALSVDTLSLKRNDQSIKIFGCISNNDFDHLKLELEKINLKEISELLNTETKVEGSLSGITTISNPYKNFISETDAIVDSLYLEGQEVGKIFVSPKYVAAQEKVELSGALIYKEVKTFNFGGNYNIPSEKLNLYLNFDKTDIGFTNAFLDPELVSDISGKLNGIVYVTGNATKPQLAGKLNLINGSAVIGLTGVRYKINGPIGVKKDVFEINYIPVYDEEGNEARLTATVNHDNFEKFNYDLEFDFDNALKGKNSFSRFMVLNTQFKDGEYYFGKAYGKGTLNISGSDSIVDISVNVETKKGTTINFPMYGAEEFEEEEDFISFVKKGTEQKIKSELDFYSGVNVDMNFNVNSDAEMKLIFDNNTGDQIAAKGFGDLNLKIDPYYNVTLNGQYKISEGSKYDFAMGNFKQPFDIVPGSTIKWNGDLLDAELNIGTSVTMKRVSLLELSPELTDKTLASQDVLCYLNLTDKLLQPSINFNIEAPKASETGKSLVRKITEDKDELNRQFFSLLLVKKFQPLKGSVTASGSAAIDMLETQMNEILGKLSNKYKLNVDYGKDETLNETSIGFGMKTQFLEDRLQVSGTFGVGGLSSGSSSNIPIGDVNIEYLINDNGTFRINAFNESSNNSSNANSANNGSGMYTQGVGISYHEEFQSWKDFLLLQYSLDLFRKEKKYWKKKEKQKNNKIPVNPEIKKPKEIIQDKKTTI